MHLAGALEYIREHSTDKNAAHLSKAANIIRKRMLKMTQDVNGLFSENCQLNSVPQSLFSMIYMLTASACNEGANELEIFKPTLFNDSPLISIHIIQLSSLLLFLKVYTFNTIL